MFRLFDRLKKLKQFESIDNCITNQQWSNGSQLSNDNVDDNDEDNDGDRESVPTMVVQHEKHRRVRHLHNNSGEHEQRRRRHSIESSATESTNTKARLRWWSDRRRQHHTNSNNNRQKSNPHNHPHHRCQTNELYSKQTPIKRIRRKKMKNLNWTEELWVDGPNVINGLSMTSSTTSPQQSNQTTNNSIIINNDSNDIQHKNHRIEQWIRATFSSDTNEQSINNENVDCKPTIDQVHTNNKKNNKSNKLIYFISDFIMA